jgi:hypothetical protein
MLSYLSRLLRAAFVTISGFGGGVALLFFIFTVVIRGERNAAPAALKAGIFFGICFASMLLAVMILLDLTAKLFIAKGLSNNFWELEQKRELILDGTVKQIVAACRLGLLSVPDVTSVSEDMNDYTAKALTGASWRSPGEEMEVVITRLSDTQCKVSCLSRPKSSKVVFDYGKNFENVETWRRFMEAELKALAK